MAKYYGIFISTAFIFWLTTPTLQAQTSRREKGKVSQYRPTKSSQVAEAKQEEDPYSGVTISGGDPPNYKPPPEGIQYITWPGFRPSASGGSEVFLQLTGPVTYKDQVKKLKVLITIDKVMVPFRNNFRPVVTSQFPHTVVKEFRLRPIKRAKDNKVLLEITLKQKAKPQVTVVTHGRYTYLVASFPASSTREEEQE